MLFSCKENNPLLNEADIKLNLIPQPNQIKTYKEVFAINRKTTFYYSESSKILKKHAMFLQDIIVENSELHLKLKSKITVSKEGILLKVQIERIMKQTNPIKLIFVKA